VVGVRGDVVLTEDGRQLRPEAPVIGADGTPLHWRGVTAAAGLHFLGSSWLHTRGSALIGWVGRDAEYLADILGVKRRLDHREQPSYHLLVIFTMPGTAC
jgi:hypothetical protein